MSNKTLCCDTCNKTHFETAIILKPKKYGFNKEVTALPQINPDGRAVDNICMDCLAKEIITMKKNVLVMKRQGVSERLKILKNNNNLSLSKMAVLIGSTKPNLSAYIRGVSLPPERILKIICTTFNVTMDWILFGEDIQTDTSKTGG